MSPFRDYRFQISGSIDGRGDFASTEVVGFYNIISTILRGKNDDKLIPTNVTYDEKYIGSHANIICHIMDSMIRACFQKFITDSPIFKKYDGVKVNLGEEETIFYEEGGFAMNDSFGKFAEVVTTYIVTGYFDQLYPDEALINLNNTTIPVYNTDGVLIAKNIKEDIVNNLE